MPKGRESFPRLKWHPYTKLKKKIELKLMLRTLHSKNFSSYVRRVCTAFINQMKQLLAYVQTDGWL